MPSPLTEFVTLTLNTAAAAEATNFIKELFSIEGVGIVQFAKAVSSSGHT